MDNGGNTEQLLETYILRIRSVLEYCAPVWGALLNGKQKHVLEMQQRKCVNIILGSNASSHAKNLSKLSIQTLEDRRQELTLNFAIKTYRSPKHTSWYTPSPQPMANTRQKLLRFVVPLTTTLRGSLAPIAYMTMLLNNMSDVDFMRQCEPLYLPSSLNPPPPTHNAPK